MAGKKNAVRKPKILNKLGPDARLLKKHHEPLTSSRQVRDYLLELGFTARIITLVKRNGRTHWAIKGNYPGKPEEFLTVSIVKRRICHCSQAPDGRTICHKSMVKIKIKNIIRNFSIREKGVDITLIDTQK